MPDVKRPYSSAVREEGARRTRAAVLDAAAALFVERGYHASSLADIAHAADVARPTVCAAFGSKAGLLEQVLDRALAGDDEPGLVAQRPWFGAVWEAVTPAAVLRAYAGVCTEIATRAAALFEVLHKAADDSPDAAALYAKTRADRHAGATMIVGRLVEMAALSNGAAAQSAVDVLWIYNDPHHFADLVLDRGWTVAAYTRWLEAQMRSALLADPGSVAGELEGPVACP